MIIISYFAIYPGSNNCIAAPKIEIIFPTWPFLSLTNYLKINTGINLSPYNRRHRCSMACSDVFSCTNQIASEQNAADCVISVVVVTRTISSAGRSRIFTQRNNIIMVHQNVQ